MVAALNDLPVLQHHDRIGVATVESRWAMTKVVRSAISRSMPCSMCFSVRVSTELVASSRIRIGALETAARAMFNSWRCPWLKFAPSPSSIVSYPSGSAMMKSWQRAFSQLRRSLPALRQDFRSECLQRWYRGTDKPSERPLRYCRSRLSQGHVPQILSAYCDRAAVHIPKPCHKTGEGGLAGARGPTMAVVVLSGW